MELSSEHQLLNSLDAKVKPGKDHGKNCVKVRPLLGDIRLRNRLLEFK